MSKPQDIKPTTHLGQLMADYARQEIRDDLDGWMAIQARLNPATASLNEANPPSPETWVRHLSGWRKWLVWELAATVLLAVAVLAVVIILQSTQPPVVSTTQIGRAVPTYTPGVTTLVIPTMAASPTRLLTTVVAPSTTASATATVTRPTSPSPTSSTFCTDFVYPGATQLKVSQQLFMGDEPEHVPTPSSQAKYGAFASAAAYSDISRFYLQSLKDCGYISNNDPQVNHQDDTLTMFSGSRGSHKLTLSIFSPQMLALSQFLSSYKETLDQLQPNQTLIIFSLI